MNVFERYFQRNEIKEYPDFADNTALIIIIPVFDDRDVFMTLDSLACCTNFYGPVGVIVVVNHAENCDNNLKERNQKLAEEIWQWIEQQQKSHTCKLQFKLIEAYNLPAKSAGVGLARKIAMDAAAAHFYKTGETIRAIASLDADTLVEPGYCDTIIRFFQEHPVAGVSIAYAHRLDDPGCVGNIREAMIKYEIYLHYYLLALRYTGHPHAWHCIGSAFAVRAIDYVSQGGMNKRQAGEDFYFIQKLIATGRYADLTATRVYPSPRISARTPFGTGQSVRQIMENAGKYPVYNFEAFRLLKPFFEKINALYKANDAAILVYVNQQPLGLREFLINIDFCAILKEVNANCASEKQFVKRFFDHFNAFRVLKYLNYIHTSTYVKQEIIEVVNYFFSILNISTTQSPEEMLNTLRTFLLPNNERDENIFGTNYTLKKKKS